MRRTVINILFALSLVILVPLLFTAATVICCVKVLKPQHLTPIVERLAEKSLDADVAIGRVALDFKPAFPILALEIDSLTVRSKVFDSLSAEERRSLPAWSDTLLTLDRFSGAIDLGAMLRGRIAVRDVTLDRAGLNIVLDRSGRGNFAIYESDTTAAPDNGAPMVIPPFSIERFTFNDTREIRYFNAVDSTGASILLLHDVSLEHEDEPSYRLVIDGNVNSPLTKAMLNLSDIAFGLDGRVKWQPRSPELLSLEEFKLRGAFINASINADVVLDSTLTVPSARIDIEPVRIADMLTVVPDSLRRQYRLTAPYFQTEGAIGLTARLLSPYRPAVDSIPAAEINVAMTDTPLTYGKVRFRRIGFDITARTDTAGLSSASVTVNRLVVAGPATTLEMSGSASDLLSDPEFKATVKGDMDLTLLPEALARMIPGAVSGTIDADFEAAGRQSMLSQQNFHRLYLRGDVTGHNLYWLSADTADMIDARTARIVLSSQHRMSDSLGKKSGDAIFGAAISVDTANVLLSGVDMAISGLSLGAGADHTITAGDTTAVVPLGGGVKIERLSVLSITDSAGARFRDVSGRVSLQRYKGNKKAPLISADLNIGSVGAGAPGTRFVLRNAHLNASTYKKPVEETASGKIIKAIADSIHREMPHLSPDSVIRLAIAKRRENRRHIRRVSLEENNDIEVLDWKLASGFRKFLLGWQLNGELTTRRARLFTPLFPLRNNVSELDIRFSNDTIRIHNLSYRAGKSDLTITGLVSNIRRALSFSGLRNPLKINFEAQSDTIDVNQLASAVFAGAAYADRLRHGDATIDLSKTDDDKALQNQLDAIASQQPDTAGPLLIPVNVDASFKVNAKNIIYSDLDFKDCSSELLLYSGALNIHDLRAKSDAGDLGMSAMYMAPTKDNMHFGFSLDLQKMNIAKFLSLVPAIDSIMPMMRDFSGYINADLAATVDVDSSMNLVLPTLDAAIRLSGEELAFINPETYATIGKWLRFRDKADNHIKRVSVEIVVRDDVLQIYPFAFDIDRYRLGVVGYNDLDMNFDYHISVLKSPLPFKFGITIKGNPDKYKIRLGGAKYKEGQVAQSVGVTDTARVNLLNQIENVFRRGMVRSKFAPLTSGKGPDIKALTDSAGAVLSPADSVALGLKAPADTVPAPTETKKTKKRRK